MKKAEKVNAGDGKSTHASKDTKGKTPDNKLIIEKEGANVKKEKGVEDVE